MMPKSFAWMVVASAAAFLIWKNTPSRPPTEMTPVLYESQHALLCMGYRDWSLEGEYVRELDEFCM